MGYQNILYLIPAPIGEKSETNPAVKNIMEGITFYIVEEIRTTRRHIKSMLPGKNINVCTFREFNEHNCEESIEDIRVLFSQRQNVALISEAGIPCVADPGWQVVRLAHQCGMKVVPLSGPSSIFMALMASGIQGQRFMFHGYLPVKKEERIRYIRDIEQKINRDNATQIFIETPYRNTSLFEDLVSTLNPALVLSISAGLDTSEAFIKSMTIKEWKSQKPELHKVPAVFVVGR